MFQNAGVMVNGKFATRRVDPAGQGPTFLLNHLQKKGVPESYFLDMERYDDWETAKGPKRDKRTAKNGFQYYYTEGGMQFPDLRNAPARTVLTSEANRTPNRSTHVVKDLENDRPRFLMPIEVERIMGFPDNWTLGLPERWRYFTMGNALVVPVVTQIGNRLAEWIKTHETEAQVERLLGKQPAPRAVPLQRAVRRGAKPISRKHTAK
jgi:DNA (cytosine-5)-methyltransferase 1